MFILMSVFYGILQVVAGIIGCIYSEQYQEEG